MDNKDGGRLKVIEKYWIQSSVTLNKQGKPVAKDRIQLELYKFNLTNDWALLIRSDGKLFEPSEITPVDRDPTSQLFRDAVVLHCPVKLLMKMEKANEFSISCNKSSVTIQNESSHHVKYDKHPTIVKGSSGGGVYVSPSTAVVGMHIEAISENDYSPPEESKKYSQTDKRVDSEEVPYEKMKGKKAAIPTDSETAASAAEGTNGYGSALIFCKFKRLMHYFDEIEKSNV